MWKFQSSAFHQRSGRTLRETILLAYIPVFLGVHIAALCLSLPLIRLVAFLGTPSAVVHLTAEMLPDGRQYFDAKVLAGPVQMIVLSVPYFLYIWH
jgi:hypothetical protein